MLLGGNSASTHELPNPAQQVASAQHGLLRESNRAVVVAEGLPVWRLVDFGSTQPPSRASRGTGHALLSRFKAAPVDASSPWAWLLAWGGDWGGEGRRELACERGQ